MPSIIWKGQLTFGLVSIPVKLFRAARRERVRLHYVHRAEAAEPAPTPSPAILPMSAAATAWPSHGLEEPTQTFESEPDSGPEPEREPLPPPVSRVRQTLVTDTDDQPVSRSELLRGYEADKDQYVVLEPEELKGLQRKTSPAMEIVRSVRLSEVDPVFFETSYYMAPGRGGEKAYAILFRALQETGHVALARVGMYGREHVVIVRPGQHGILAHTMFYTDEIRFENEFRTDAQSVGEKELALARTFLEALEAPFSPEEFKDTYRDELQAIIARKQASAGIASPAPPPIAPPPGVDILEALRKSIEMRRKPARSETQPAPAAGKRPRKTR